MVQLLHPYVTPGKKCTFGGAFVYVLLIHLLIIKYLLTAYYPGDAAEDGTGCHDLSFLNVEF